MILTFYVACVWSLVKCWMWIHYEMVLNQTNFFSGWLKKSKLLMAVFSSLFWILKLFFLFFDSQKCRILGFLWLKGIDWGFGASFLLVSYHLSINMIVLVSLRPNLLILYISGWLSLTLSNFCLSSQNYFMYSANTFAFMFVSNL